MRATSQSVLEPRPKATRIFRSTRWDIIPATLLAAHAMGLALLLYFWTDISWIQRFGGGMAYALAIGWNLDSVAHNFIHNPFFTSRRLNRLTELLLTLVNGVPQTMYRFVHMKHHAGNCDYPDENGVTIDPISIYQFGADGHPEPMWRYVLLQFWRDDGPFTVVRQIAAKRPQEAARALHEFWFLAITYGVLFILDWQAVLFLAPFYYLGQCMTALIAYYEHLGGNPKLKIAWGVSTYAPAYNWLFLNNGYHAEHHHQPKAHWSKMKTVRAALSDEMAASEIRVLKHAHALGFLDKTSWLIPTATRQ